MNKLLKYESHNRRKQTSKKYVQATVRYYNELMMKKNVKQSFQQNTVYEKYFKDAGLKFKNLKKDT